jgi:hypothetical protein
MDDVAFKILESKATFQLQDSSPRFIEHNNNCHLL